MTRTLALTLSLLTATPALATTWRVNTGLAESSGLTNVISALDHADVPIDAWAVDPDGEWIVVSAQGVVSSAGFDPTIVTGAVLNRFFGRRIEAIDCSESGRCVLVHSMGHVANGPVPSALVSRITSWHNAGWAIRDVELTDQGWLLLGPGSVAAYSGLDPDLSAAIFDRRLSGRQIRDVAIDGARWLLYADSHPMYEGLDAFTRTWVDAGATVGLGFDHLMLVPGGGFVFVQPDDTLWQPDLTDPVEAVEHGLAGGNLWARMQAYGVNGLSIAIVQDGEVVSARGYGTRTAGFQQPVLGSTPFDIASLSKYVGAVTTLAVMRRAGTQVGLITDLTQTNLGTVNTWLTRGAANPAAQGFPFINRPTMPSFTLEQLLSHTAAMSTGGSTPVPFWFHDEEDEQLDTVEWLSGWSCGTFSCGWSGAQTVWFDPSVGANGFGGAPGAQFAYSSHGYLVAQAVVEDLGRDRIEDLMQDLVFGPMGLTDTRAGFPLDEPSYSGRAAAQHDDQGALYRTVYPWVMAGGVTSSARDYAALMTLTLNDGLAPNGERILSASDAAELRRGRQFGNLRFAAGLGLLFDGSGGAGEVNGEAFYHSGKHPGRANTYMCGRPADGSGIVILMNTDDPDGSTDDLRDELLDAFEAAMGWEDTDCR